jgi:hypothetical protein
MNSTTEASSKENNEIVLPEDPKISTIIEDSTKSALHTNAGISDIDMDVSQEEQETTTNVVVLAASEDQTNNNNIENFMDTSQEDENTNDDTDSFKKNEDIQNHLVTHKTSVPEIPMGKETVEEVQESVPSLFVVGKTVDVQKHSRVIEALERHNESQKTSNTDAFSNCNDEFAVKEEDDNLNVVIESKVAAPPAPFDVNNLSTMPPLPPKANANTTAASNATVTTTSTNITKTFKTKYKEIKGSVIMNKQSKVRNAPERMKGVSPMKKKQRYLRHSISSMGSLKSRRPARTTTNGKSNNHSFLKSGAVRNGSIKKSKVLNPTLKKKSASKVQQRSRLRASTGAFKTSFKRNIASSSAQDVPSYMRGTSSSSSRVRRSSSFEVRDREKANLNSNKKVDNEKGSAKHNKFTRKKKPSLTVPTAPKFTTRESHSRKKVVLSSEEIQIQESERRREELAKRRKMNAKMWNLASTSDGTLGVPAGTLGQVLKPKSLTEAKSPNFQAHPVKKTVTETTEERELREIELKKEEIARRKKNSYRRWSLAQQGSDNKTKSTVAVSTKPLTEAKTPFLHTKAKKGPKIRVGLMARPKVTSMRLRSYNRKEPVKAIHKLTVPTTPKFASDSRIGRKINNRTNGDSDDKKNVSNEPYVSVAEMANKVWNGKNLRFIKEPKGSKPKIPINLTDTGPKEVTEPHTPRFQTSSRVRQNEHVESHDEREAREMAEIAAHPFKATKFDEKIKESNGELGVSRVQRKPLTKPESPKFATDSRVNRRNSLNCINTVPEKTRVFKALAVGEGVPEYHAPPVQKKKLTEFKPFNLSTDKRAAAHQTVAITEKSPSKYKPFKARPMPSVQTAPVPKVKKKELTIPQSPQLLGVKKSLMAKKVLEEKIKKQQEDAERKRVFKAKSVGEGLPSNENNHYQQPYNPQYEIKPFNLSVDPTGAQARRLRQIETENKTMQENRKFKARELPSTHSKPFILSKSSKKPFTEIKEFKLRSNARSEQHKKFDLAAKKRREEAVETRRLKQMQADEEAAEAYKAEFERTRVDKVRKSKEDVKKFLNTPAVSTTASKKRLVIPRSPKLGAARRVLKQ